MNFVEDISHFLNSAYCMQYELMYFFSGQFDSRASSETEADNYQADAEMNEKDDSDAEQVAGSACIGIDIYVCIILSLSFD